MLEYFDKLMKVQKKTIVFRILILIGILSDKKDQAFVNEHRYRLKGPKREIFVAGIFCLNSDLYG
jgi:hypothetical protein